MVKILYNNSCSKSRGILEYLDENGVPFEIIDFIKNPLSELEIRTVLKKLRMAAKDLIRKNEKIFKENYLDKELSEDEWVKVLVENPSLIQRPILIKDGVAMIGRPVEVAKFFIVN
ncbi:arsenate reductase (glutaredoxin) [Chryseobacterium sp. SNU WT5]|uniref:ArsC/Spx/MgsR family protein n=1 Tax=Chryseobacterium sp. SNU WT5 TaxID=2594269 RepID=UPI00117FF682|nr:ArsC/Spx/MgsR family protein [Chryseobacterium sp. SNU WT5]QDP84257.1 arsenate reductase (glutaredoxin) [Chryseobacterium sp. SNU WT5]